MTVSSSSGVLVLKGDGATTGFSFNFAFPAVSTPTAGANYLLVEYTDPIGLQTVVAYGPAQNNYQLAINPPIPPNPTPVGGVVTYAPGGNPIPSGSLLTIQRILPVVQPVSLLNQGTLWQQAIEQEFDYLTMLAQGIITPTGGAVSSFNGRGGAVTLLGTDVAAAGGALLNSPTFTGTPTAPTPPPNTSNNQIATTAFVLANGGGPGNRQLLRSILPTFPTLNVPMFWSFTNQYDQYEIDIYDVQTSANPGPSDFMMHISWDGVTWDTTANYASAYLSQSMGGNLNSFGTFNAMFLGWAPTSGLAPGQMGEYKIKFSMPWVTDRNKTFMIDSVSWIGTYGLVRLSSVAQYNSANQAGYQPIKGFRFFEGNGNNITRGIFNLYGIVKASAGT